MCASPSADTLTSRGSARRSRALQGDGLGHLRGLTYDVDSDVAGWKWQELLKQRRRVQWYHLA
jgi:hypothetical protein